MSNRWTRYDFDQLKLTEVSPGVFKKLAKTDPSLPAKKQPKKGKSKAYKQMYADLCSLKIDFVMEHRFDPNRKFKFDFAIIDKKIAIEYEGLMSDKSRHTTVTGYSKDADKYNLAANQGWKVLRFTTLNHNTLLSVLQPLLTSIQKEQ